MRYWLETLGCPKNQVDSDKLSGRLQAVGYDLAPDPGTADLIVVNTCASSKRPVSSRSRRSCRSRSSGRRAPGWW